MKWIDKLHIWMAKRMKPKYYIFNELSEQDEAV